MIKSEVIADLLSALSLAQKVIKGAVKDSENPFYKHNYADLASVWDACRDALSDNGLCVVQTIQQVDGDKNLHLETMLGHKTGQYIISVTPIKSKDESPQAMGSAISYARRYALAAIVGVYQIDDDAEGTKQKGKPVVEQPSAKTAKEVAGEVGEITKEVLVAAARRSGIALANVKKHIEKTYDGRATDKLTKDEMKAVYNWILEGGK